NTLPSSRSRVSVKRRRRSFFLQAEDGIRAFHVTGVQTCALPICRPILVGTQDVAESEELAEKLRKAGLECTVLNARNDAEEAERSEERRVGKVCSPRGAPDDEREGAGQHEDSRQELRLARAARVR